jgi:PAS domain S-box-containing protein/excisionase family DNA binding protein
MISASNSLDVADDRSVQVTAERSFYNISQAAALLGVSRMSIWRWIRAGRLPVARLGHRTIRIRHEDLELLLAERGLATSQLRVMPDRPIGPQARNGLDGQCAPHPLLSEIGSAEHFVQFYEVDAVLLDAVSAYLSAALRRGGTGIVIATAAHRQGIEARLRADGLDPAAEQASGRYIALDAAETLARFMVDGQPEPGRFAEVVGSLVAQAAERGQPVHAFGEMVALLAAAGQPAAAIQLEALWNGLQQVHTFALFCAYPMEVLSGEDSAALFGDIAGEHAHVIPAESYTALPDSDARLREVARLQQQAAALRVEVAERRRIEAQLHRRERELRDFVENATEGLHWVGPDGRILWANRAEMALLGYTADEYLGRSIADFHADPEVIADILRRLGADEELHDYEARLRAKDGSIKYVLINSNVYREDGRFIHTRCFTRDITERKLAEAASLRLAAIVESSDDAIIGKTLDGAIVDWNRGAEQLYGYTAAEVIGRPIALLIPDDRPDEFPAIMGQLRRGERIDHFETERVRKDGQRLTVSVTISPVRDLAGQIVGASAIARDITERKQAEQEREALLAREQQARTEAEVALRLRDEFLSVASHELRTPLAALKGYAQIALRRLERVGQVEPERMAEALRVIAKQSDKLDRLLSQLLDISRLEAGKLTLDPQPTDLTVLVEQVVASMRARGATHPITVSAPPALEAQVDPLRLEQVLVNLLDNAIKYSPDASPIEVTVSRSAHDDALEIAMRDHGLGIPPEKRARIFERFYQAHDSSFRSGLGLGLHISCEIVELHGGAITAEFPPDGGSCFVVRLPLSR